jgi:DNA-directed RNA polymerase subunit RPC12/RpoP
MASVDQVHSKMNEPVVGPHDILFECPACSKSLVVDEDGEGMIVDCPQCHINVIVPPKTAKPAAPITPVIPPPSTVPVAEPEVSDDVRTRLTALGNKMKELQTQRAEINNRMASRINEINRDLVMTARLETAHQQVIAELNELIAHVAGSASTNSPAGRTRVNLRS